MADSYRSREGKQAGVIRCPYCVESGNFKVMASPESGDGHICHRCGHVVLPSNPMFACACSKCERLKIS
jgi:hypothetical protein